MSNVQQTSITAYNEEVRSGKIPSQRCRILKIIEHHEPISRRAIRERCRYGSQYWEGIGFMPNIPMSSVCGRVRCLIDSNLVHVCDHKEDEITGKRVQVLAYGPDPIKGISHGEFNKRTNPVHL